MSYNFKMTNFLQINSAVFYFSLAGRHDEAKKCIFATFGFNIQKKDCML